MVYSQSPPSLKAPSLACLILDLGRSSPLYSLGHYSYNLLAIQSRGFNQPSSLVASASIVAVPSATAIVQAQNINKTRFLVERKGVDKLQNSRLHEEKAPRFSYAQRPHVRGITGSRACVCSTLRVPDPSSYAFQAPYAFAATLREVNGILLRVRQYAGVCIYIFTFHRFFTLFFNFRVLSF